VSSLIDFQFRPTVS